MYIKHLLSQVIQGKKISAQPQRDRCSITTLPPAGLRQGSQTVSEEGAEGKIQRLGRIGVELPMLLEHTANTYLA